MSEPITFKWVEVEGFRGFRDRQRINLAGSAILVIGPNGSGKTSLFDALQWLLVGSLRRLEPWRVRKNAEHIVNQYWLPKPAVVEAQLVLGDRRVQLRREGKFDSGFLEWTDDDGVTRGEEAERKVRDALMADRQDSHRFLMTSAMLQQDVVRDILQDKPTERFEHLAGLLGLDDVAAFDSAARRRADRLASSGREAREEAAQAQSRADAAQADVEALALEASGIGDLEETRDELAEELQGGLTAVELRSPIPGSTSDIALMRSAIRQLVSELASLVADHEEAGARAVALQPVSPADLAGAQQQLDRAAEVSSQARAGLAEAEERLGVANRNATALQALASQALPLLSDECPVCGQTIDPSDVATHLKAVIEAGAADLPALSRETETLAAAAEEADRALATARERLVELEAVQSDSDRLAHELDRVRARCAGFRVPPAASVRVRLLDQIVAADFSVIRDTLAELQVVERFSETLAGLLRNREIEQRLRSSEQTLAEAVAAADALKERAANASSMEEEGRVIQRSATRAASSVTERRFRLLAPTIQDIFWRLDPHPAFKELDFALEIYRQRGIASPIVRDKQEAIEADPLLIFSSSQANVAALSYFLALGWAAGEQAPPFVLMDDPLQSMDDVNALGFSDLCRHLRRQRQLVASTHERRLAALLERKLAPRREGETTRIVEFKAWTRRGPEIEQRALSPQVTEGTEFSVVPEQAA